MKHRLRPVIVACAAVVVLAVAATGCGGDDDDDGGAVSTFTPEELSAALLTAEDLGSGWTESQRDTFTARSPENPSVEESVSFCPEAEEQAATLDELASDAGADVEFEQSGTTPHLLRQQAWSDGNVDEYYATLSEAFDLCLGEQWTDDAGNQVTFEVLDGPQVGDESTSVTGVVVLETPDGEVAYRGPFTVARFGTALMAIGDLTIGRLDEPVPPSEPDWSTIVETAAANLDELTGN